MARVHVPKVGVKAPAALRHRTLDRRKPSYKVVLEEVSEKKKLKTFLSFNPEAPPGYTFIPAGDPQLTNRCKKLAREQDSNVYIVSMSNPRNPELSKEVHRVGYHFSSIVVENACQSLGVTLTETGRVAQSSLAGLNEDLPGRKPKKRLKRKGRESPKFDLSMSQATIDTHAREAITDLFPKIPSEDLHQVIARSFQKGSHLVGTSSDLSLVRRAHLAVAAHIRHTHTDYDQLLKLVPWSEARRRVEAITLDKVIAWRGDDDADSDVMHDVLREVIVISDDEDEGDDEDECKKAFDGLNIRRASLGPSKPTRQVDLEVISEENIHTQPLNLAKDDLQDSENEEPVQYVHSVHSPFDSRSQLREERSGARRLRRWEDAIHRQKNAPPPVPVQRNPSASDAQLSHMKGELGMQNRRISDNVNPFKHSQVFLNPVHEIQNVVEHQQQHRTQVSAPPHSGRPQSRRIQVGLYEFEPSDSSQFSLPSIQHAPIPSTQDHLSSQWEHSSAVDGGRYPFQRVMRAAEPVLAHEKSSRPTGVAKPRELHYHADRPVAYISQADRILPSVENDVNDSRLPSRNDYYPSHFEPAEPHRSSRSYEHDRLTTMPLQRSDEDQIHQRHRLSGEGKIFMHEDLQQPPNGAKRPVDRIVYLNSHNSHDLNPKKRPHNAESRHAEDRPRIIQLPARDSLGEVSSRRPHRDIVSDMPLHPAKNARLLRELPPADDSRSNPEYEKSNGRLVRLEPSMLSVPYHEHPRIARDSNYDRLAYAQGRENLRPEAWNDGSLQHADVDRSQRFSANTMPVPRDEALPMLDRESYRYDSRQFVEQRRPVVYHEYRSAAPQGSQDQPAAPRIEAPRAAQSERIIWLKRAEDSEPMQHRPASNPATSHYHQAEYPHHPLQTYLERSRPDQRDEVIVLD